MAAKRTVSAATPGNTSAGRKTRQNGADGQQTASWMTSYLAECAGKDRAMRDMVKLVQDSGIDAVLNLSGGVWYVVLGNDETQTFGDANGADLTDVLSRAYNRQREARAAFDAKAQATR